MQKKFLSVPILVLSILFQILIFVLMGLLVSAGVAVATASSTGAGLEDPATVGFVGASVGVILVSLLMSAIGLALFIMQIIAAVRIKDENKTIMALYIVGFFVPICTLIAAGMAIHKKLY
ncbi:hypothetical protein [Mycoplasma sp. 1199]|uniref:hypothetical protein n=1 Tax=unclassified Mycoplasma TaxID=2683645 RepID=UPI002B1DDA9B|nr:hypothetical protein [Mycoplasma sp. 1199]MEA4206201.1 hypothetical protein [Mycoplasma sp. 1199]